jgi:hypothetical protein
MGPTYRQLSMLMHHLRQHVIACLALVCSVLSLAGASYAALELPAGSVGARQLKNHAITPVKFDPAGIGGSVRHWAQVDAEGRVITGSGHARAARGGNQIEVNWGDKFSARCVALATVRGHGDASVGAVEAFIEQQGVHPTVAIITGSNAAGQPVAQPFYVAVIC